MKTDKNNQMVSFNKLMEYFNKPYDVYIPLIQRNYKWDKETAKKLAKDLKDACDKQQEIYTVGMITLYEEKAEKTFQLLDGQQRMITFYLILKCLNSQEEYFSFRFERDDEFEQDDKSSRKNYLKEIDKKPQAAYTDLERFLENYNVVEDMLKDVLEKEEYKEKLITYIKDNTYFLLHISKAEPFDEFINLNKNKTRFVISDKIKAYLIMGSKEREKVLELFQSLSEVLFAKNELWELLSKNYAENEVPSQGKRIPDKLYPDENRLKLLCCERYRESEYNILGTQDEVEKEFALLNKYKDMLWQIVEDIENSEHPNWNSYHAISCLGQLESEYRFFKMLHDFEDEKLNYLEEYLLKKFSTLDKFHKSCFIESQLQYNKKDYDKENGLFYLSSILVKNPFDMDEQKWNEIKKDFEKTKNLECEKTKWLYTEENSEETFMEIYMEYIIEKYSGEEQQN